MSYQDKLIKLSKVVSEKYLYVHFAYPYNTITSSVHKTINQLLNNGYDIIIQYNNNRLEVKCNLPYTGEKHKLEYPSSDNKSNIIIPGTLEEEDRFKECLAKLILCHGKYRDFENFNWFSTDLRAKLFLARDTALKNTFKEYGLDFICNKNCLTDDEIVIKDIIE